jgi:hypothetical protein
LASVKSWLKKVKRYSQSFQGGDSSSSTKVGFPVIIAACKSDTVKSEDTATLKRAKEVQGQLRSLSLSVGCSLIYTSAVGDINCALLKKYISHTLFPENVPMDLALEVRTCGTEVYNFASTSVCTEILDKPQDTVDRASSVLL